MTDERVCINCGAVKAPRHRCTPDARLARAMEETARHVRSLASPSANQVTFEEEVLSRVHDGCVILARSVDISAIALIMTVGGCAADEAAERWRAAAAAYERHPEGTR